MKNQIIKRFSKLFSIFSIVTVLSITVFTQEQVQNIYQMSLKTAEQVQHKIEFSESTNYYTIKKHEKAANEQNAKINEKSCPGSATELIRAKPDSVMFENIFVSNFTIAAYLNDNPAGGKNLLKSRFFIKPAPKENLKTPAKPTGNSAKCIDLSDDFADKN